MTVAKAGYEALSSRTREADSAMLWRNTGASSMNLEQVLQEYSGEIVNESLDALRRAHLKHYENAGLESTRQRLETLYQVTVRSINTRKAGPLVEYAESVARERFAAGFDLFEVQTSFNVLEEAMWRKMLQHVEPRDLALALGLVSTALGMGKDALARTYVSLASETRAPSLDLRALLKGTNGT